MVLETIKSSGGHYIALDEPAEDTDVKATIADLLERIKQLEASEKERQTG